ncbi:hypothetical protein B0H13DRAFT_1857060 [Mycena leptocephala]|nr:hypothetical protein B0H13DRAFT_1857060 [Mycena leptocephala]
MSAGGAMLDSAIAALTVATTGVTGIGVPGVEPVLNSVLQIATMISTMKDNRESLVNLREQLEVLTAAIYVQGAGGALQSRLQILASTFAALITDCQSLANKSRLAQFFNSSKYQSKISNIRDSFHGNISIERLVTDIQSEGAVTFVFEPTAGSI